MESANVPRLQVVKNSAFGYTVTSGLTESFDAELITAISFRSEAEETMELAHRSRLVTILIAGAMLWPLAVRAQPAFQASFTAPVVAGETATLVISTNPDHFPPPDCGWCSRWTYVAVKWGDSDNGEVVWNQTDSQACGLTPPPSGPTVFEAQHTYAWPGPYQVTVWFYSSFSAAEACRATYVPPFVAPQIQSLEVRAGTTARVGGWLGVFFDRAATICGQEATAGTSLYVVAGLGGDASAGIAGAEFCVRSSAPESFAFVETPEPGWIKIGNACATPGLHQISGATMAASCATTAGQNQIVILKLVAIPLVSTSDVRLSIERPPQSSNPTYRSPVIVLCDEPVFTAIPARGAFAAVLNPPVGASPCGPTSVAVRSSTWGQLKALYRSR